MKIGGSLTRLMVSFEALQLGLELIHRGRHDVNDVKALLLQFFQKVWQCVSRCAVNVVKQ